ncbi:MAG: hypothetical protein ACO3H6_00270 [Bacilli bacterium]
MTFKTTVLSLVGVVLLASCGQSPTPVSALVSTAESMVQLDEGLTQEASYETMGQQPMMRMAPEWLPMNMVNPFSNDLVEIRELLEILRTEQQAQNQFRLRLRLEATIVKAFVEAMAENDFSIPENVNTAVAEEQAILQVLKTDMSSTRSEIREAWQSLRTLMQQAERPLRLNETLIAEIKTILTDLVPLVQTLKAQLSDTLSSLQAIRLILIEAVPASISPWTEAVALEVSRFETQLVAMENLVTTIRELRQAIATLMRDIRQTRVALKEAGISLTLSEITAITVKQLDVVSIRGDLGEIVASMKTVREAMQGQFNLDQLATLNDQFATLLASSETMLTPLTALVTLLTDVQALLASKL